MQFDVTRVVCASGHWQLRQPSCDYSTGNVHSESLNLLSLLILYLYLYTIFDQRRLDIIDQVEHGRSPQQVTHLPPVWDLLLPLA